MSFRNRHSFRTAQRHSMSGLGNIIDDISSWAGDAKGNAKNWLDENIAKGTGNIAESLGNEAVDYGKGYATEKANEQIKNLLNQGGSSNQGSSQSTSTSIPTRNTSTPLPPTTTNQTQQPANTSSDKNLLQKINPFYTGTALAVGTALTTKSVGWTALSFALGTILHHKYRVNRESN